MASGRQPDVKMEQYEDQLKDDYDNQDLEELDHQEEEIISEELVHEDMLGDGVQIEYVEEGDLAVGEVILDGNGEVMEDEMATQSLVALSRGAKDQRKGMRTEYVQHVAVQKSSPRILRRPAMSQRGFVYEQGTSRQQAPVVKPNFPVPAQTKRLLPVATLPAKNHGNWREEQKRQLEVYEIYDVLPDHMRNTFRTILDSKGQKLPVRTKPNPVRRGGRDFGDVPPETADRIYKESESLDEQHRQMDKKDIDSAEYTDMPQLEEAADDSQNGGEAQIDVEHLDSNDDGQIAMQYIMDDDTELVEMDYREQDKMNHREQVIMQDIREEYYADSNGYQQNQMVMPNCYTDTRYCPGCKLHLKRSIYYHHSRMIKKYGICNMFTPKRFPCSVPGCDEKLGTVEKLCEHMHQIHNAPTDIKTEVFESKETFGAFLQELEAKGGNFRMSRGNKMIKTGMVQYFRCNRTQAMAKDKTMRICDEVGLYGEPVESGYVQRPEDPFANRITGGKPQLRTEDACTAFYRKAFLPNGQIEVRYCDHHLHEDERLRLPQQVKERIYDMHRKKLQPTVILMVLKEERQQFALPGSAVERKILCLTPKDISAVISTRNSNARKRNKARESGKNIAADCDELSFDESAILTETERRCLEQYMNNESTILRDMAEIKRVENRRRHLRETIRNNVFQLGRYIRTSPFAELPIDMLEKICENVKTAATLTRMKSNEPGMGAKSSDAGDPYMMRHAEMQEMDNNQYDDPSVTVDGTVDAIDDSYLTAMEHEQSTSMHMHEEHEEQVMDNSGHMEDQEQIIVDQEPEMEPPAKKKRGRKPKSLVPVEVVAPAPDRRVKEENVDYDQDSVNLPSRTRTGRVVRPSHKLMDM